MPGFVYCVGWHPLWEDWQGVPGRRGHFAELKKTFGGWGNRLCRVQLFGFFFFYLIQKNDKMGKVTIRCYVHKKVFKRQIFLVHDQNLCPHVNVLKCDQTYVNHFIHGHIIQCKKCRLLTDVNLK